MDRIDWLTFLLQAWGAPALGTTATQSLADDAEDRAIVNYTAANYDSRWYF